ncbi:MAG: hypothetical protein KKA65_00330 [Nanoarchaeota archaeon]|nr:hypothetical protein [Nanoarchaeota archaeon]MBU4352421.1 hypothetical protein [Nanoarchaeota archaeon]MBU4455931.1 hypothetical protein [Nanoarchaeota archaeon]MCG2720362.1 hypothetical protein [Nanoarchaeota archaeon]
MSLELYLINNESSYQLYHNSSKTEDSKLEELVEEVKENKFSKIKEYLNNTRFKKFLDNYIQKAITRLQNTSLRSFKAASLIAEVNVNYSTNLTEKEAKKAYRKIVRREIFKNSLNIGLNLLAIAVCYVPPIALIPGSSIPFVIIGYQSAKSLKAILKGKNKINFIKNEELFLLEDIIENNKPTDNLKNKDLLEYYEANYGA